MVSSCLCRIASTWAWKTSYRSLAKTFCRSYHCLSLALEKGLQSSKCKPHVVPLRRFQGRVSFKISGRSSLLVPCYSLHILNQRKASGFNRWNGEPLKLRVVKWWKFEAVAQPPSDPGSEALSLALGTPSQQSGEVACCSSQVLPMTHQTLL